MYHWQSWKAPVMQCGEQTHHKHGMGPHDSALRMLMAPNHTSLILHGLWKLSSQVVLCEHLFGPTSLWGYSDLLCFQDSYQLRFCLLIDKMRTGKQAKFLIKLTYQNCELWKTSCKPQMDHMTFLRLKFLRNQCTIGPTPTIQGWNKLWWDFF